MANEPIKTPQLQRLSAQQAKRSYNARRTAEIKHLKTRIAELEKALEHYADEEWLHSFGGTKLAQHVLDKFNPPLPLDTLKLKPLVADAALKGEAT